MTPYIRLLVGSYATMAFTMHLHGRSSAHLKHRLNDARACFVGLADANADVAALLHRVHAEGGARAASPPPEATEAEQVAELVERAMLGDFDELYSSAELQQYAPYDGMRPQEPSRPDSTEFSSGLSRAATGQSELPSVPMRPAPVRTGAAQTASANDAAASSSSQAAPADAPRGTTSAGFRSAQPARTTPAEQSPAQRNAALEPDWSDAQLAQPEVQAALDLRSKLHVAEALPVNDARRPLWLGAIAIKAAQLGIDAIERAPLSRAGMCSFQAHVCNAAGWNICAEVTRCTR